MRGRGEAVKATTFWPALPGEIVCGPQGRKRTGEDRSKGGNEGVGLEKKNG